MLNTTWLFHQSLGAKELSLAQEHRLPSLIPMYDNLGQG